MPICRTFRAVLALGIILFGFSPVAFAKVTKCEFLLVPPEAGTPVSVNSMWLRIAAPLKLTAEEVQDVETISDLMEHLFAGQVKSLASVRHAFFSSEMKELQARFNQLEQRVLTAQRTGTDGLVARSRQIVRLESEIERIETFRARGKPELAIAELQKTLSRWSNYLGRPIDTANLDDRGVDLWVIRNKAEILHKKRELQRQSRQAQTFFTAALPRIRQSAKVIGRFIEGPGDISYEELFTFSLLYAAIDDLFENLTDPEVKNEAVHNKQIIGDYEYISGFALSDVWNEVDDFVADAGKNRRVEPDRLAGFASQVERMEKQFRRGLLPLPVVHGVSLQTQLALGFLPIYWMRLAPEPTPDTVLNIRAHGGKVYIQEMLAEMEGYHATGLSFADARASNGKLSASLAIWEELLEAAFASPVPSKSFALLHVLRFHDLYLAEFEVPTVDWSRRDEVLRLLLEQTVILRDERSGGFDVNQNFAHTVQQLSFHYEKIFGWKRKWDFNEILTSIDALAQPLITPETMSEADLDGTTLMALELQPIQPIRRLLKLLEKEGRL